MKNDLRNKAYRMKLKILELAKDAFPNGVHIGGALSSVEILAVLTEIASLNGSPDRDRIILSKAHGALSLYTALWQSGTVDEDFLSAFDKDGSDVYVHPSRDIKAGIEFSGGSLGLGISYAVGQACALKLAGSAAKVYCIVGDGELDEGIVWEALMCASSNNLDNLVVTVDLNGYQIDGATDNVLSLGNVGAKLEAFGFDTCELDGHDVEALEKAYGHEPASGKPRAIIAHTVKGNGVDFLMGTKDSHYCALSGKKYEKAVEQITKASQHDI